MLNSIMTEGASERAIMDILLENNLLIFNADSLIESPSGKVIFEGLRIKEFSKEFLSHSFQDEVTVHVVMDDPKRQIKLEKYSNQVKVVKCYITREEIEAIHLHFNKEWWAQYKLYQKKNSGKSSKPSAFFKTPSPQGLGIPTIKKYDYVYNMWAAEPQKLVQAIRAVQNEMNRKKSLRGFQNCYCLADILKA